MKLLIKKLILLFCIIFFIGNAISYFILNSKQGISFFQLTEPYRAIYKSKTIPIESDIIVLGGSICNSLYPTKIHKNSFTTWGTSLMPGYFFLAKNVIERSENISTVLLFETPTGINREFNQTNTFGSLVKPFFDLKNLKEFKGLLFDYMSNEPLSFLSILPLTKVTRLQSDINFRKPVDVNKKEFILSDISIFYLNRLKEICDANDIKLILRSPPVNKQLFKKKTNDWENMKEQVKILRMEDIFDGYFESLIYKDSIHFRDYAHFKKEYIDKEGNNILSKVLKEDLFRKLTKTANPINYSGNKLTVEYKKTEKKSLNHIYKEYYIDFWINFNPKGPFKLSKTTPRMPALIGGIGFYEKSEYELQIYSKTDSSSTGVKIPLEKGWHKLTIISKNNKTLIKVNDIIFKELAHLTPLNNKHCIIGLGYGERYWEGVLGDINFYAFDENKKKFFLKNLTEKESKKDVIK